MIVVAQEKGEAADRFDRRGQIRPAELLAKLKEVALPVAELLVIGECPGGVGC